VGTRNFLPTVQDDTRYQINNGVSIITGRHNVKLGGDYTYLTTFQSFGFNQFGSFSFRTSTFNTVLQAMSTAPGQSRFDVPNTVTYSREIGNLLADYHMHQIAFYAQDNFRITPHIQVTFGLRWEGAVNPTPVANNDTVVNVIRSAVLAYGEKFDPGTLHNNLNQFMPRAGFTWSPGQKNQTVIRGYTGIFYAASPMLIFGGTTNNFRNPPGDVSLTLLDTPTLSMYNVFKQAGYDLNTFTLDKLPVIPLDVVTKAASILSGGAAPNPFNQASFTGTANDFQNPRSFQAGLGFDREVTKGWTVGAQTNYINTVHLERNRDYNLPAPEIRASDGRAIFTRANRPLPQYGSITLRESSARSMYRGLTMKTEYRARKYQFALNWTVSQGYSDDDNERSAGGYTYDNPYNLRPEYG